MSGNEDSLDAIRAELTDGDAVGVTKGPDDSSADAGGFRDELSGGVVDQPESDPASSSTGPAAGADDGGGGGGGTDATRNPASTQTGPALDAGVGGGGGDNTGTDTGTEPTRNPATSKTGPAVDAGDTGTDTKPVNSGAGEAVSSIDVGGDSQGADGPGTPPADGDGGAEAVQGGSFRQAPESVGGGFAPPTDAPAAQGSPLAGTDEAVGEAVDTAVEAVEDSPLADVGAGLAAASRGAAGFANRNVVEPAADTIGSVVENSPVGQVIRGEGPGRRTLEGGLLDTGEPESGLGQTTEGVVGTFGRSATGATLGAPAGAVESANIAGQAIEFTGEAVAEEGLKEGVTEAGEAAADTAQSAADRAVTAATERPLQTGAALLGGAAGAFGGGVGLGRAVRGVRRRSRTVGGTDVDPSDLASQDVLKGETDFPGIDDPDALADDPAAAVAAQADRQTPDVVAEQFDAAGVEGSDLVKALDVEPGGPARRRTAQGLQAPEADSELAGEFETAGTSVGPELSPNFLRIEGGERSISLRPGVPDLDPGGQPTAVFVRTDVENPEADTTAQLDAELREAEGDTTARAIQPGMEGFDPFEEAEAQVPPGAEFVDVGTGPVRDALRRVGIGADFRTEIEGRTVPIRTVAPEGEVDAGSRNLIRDPGDLADDTRATLGGDTGRSRVTRTLGDGRRGGDTDIVDRPLPTLGGPDSIATGGGSAPADPAGPVLTGGSAPSDGDGEGSESGPPAGGDSEPPGGGPTVITDPGPPGGDGDGPGASDGSSIFGGGSTTDEPGGPTDPPGGGGGITQPGVPVLEPPSEPPRRRPRRDGPEEEEQPFSGGFVSQSDTFDSGILSAADVLDS